MISLTMTMEDLVQNHPNIVPTLVRRNIICILCGEPVWGTLEEALLRAGIRDPAKQQEVLEELEVTLSKEAGEH